MILQSIAIASRSAAVDHHTRPSPPPVRQGITEFVEGRRRFLYWTDYNELSKAVGSISSGLLGFLSVGQVDTKGKARKLPVKPDIRKALCFPGGSTLMISHLQK
ncbi:hypothetical protein L2E82_35591 [Cichorium intybus]|uniref:Uncharacterized protein n=1 Tax=Cichorium intybus TaxID=13427 RepID=A0ACB9BP71_CICIN|nr:hypothetical protein L2E82_35591 [Cichorium intybus]